MGGTVHVELLGVARFLARREVLEIDVPATVPLADFARRVAAEAPALVGNVLGEEGTLIAGHVFARGSGLLRDAEDPIHPGDRLMLLSTSAGG